MSPLEILSSDGVPVGGWWVVGCGALTRDLTHNTFYGDYFVWYEVLQDFGIFCKRPDIVASR